MSNVTKTARMGCKLAALLALAVAFAAKGYGDVQTGATMTFSGRSFLVKDASGNEHTFAAGESLCPTQEPAVFLIKPVLAANEHLFCITGGDKLHEATFYRYPLADGWVPFAPFASAESNMTVKAVIAAGVIYVDAEHGNDDWDGSVDYEHRDEPNNRGPKQTLQAAHDAATSDYEIVYAAPGTYSNGVTTVTSTKNDVTYTCRRRLHASRPIGFRSTGGAENTFIVGAPDPDPQDTGLTPVDGCGDNAIAGVHMSCNGAQFLQGFTITGCYTPLRADRFIHYGAAFCSGANRASMVDCIVSNNYAYSGPTACYGTHYRCRFFENEAHQYTVGSYGNYHSCLFSGNRINSTDKDQGGRAFACYCNLFNCTIDLRSTKNPSGRSRVAYNSEYKVSNCIIVGYKGTETDIFENTLRSGDLLLADADARDFRPGVLSPAVDSLAYADLPDEVRRGDGVDLDGRFAVVRNGMATLGAVQDTVPCVVLLGSSGETVSEGWSLGTNLVTAAGNVTITANASRPLIGFEVDGTLLPYSGHSYSFAVPTEPGVSKTVKAVYDTNWYVDCVNGNDADDGAFGRPKQTIRAATTNAVAGDVIHVAPGTYGAAEGSQAATSSAKIGTRVVVPAGVTLESTGGATNTFIVGAEATGDQIDNATYGTGTNAIRCVYAKSGAVVRGFTLTGGRGIGVSEASGEGRGAAFCSSAVREAVLEDCIVSNNAAYMATIYQTVVRRCRVIGNIGTRTDNVSAPAGSACNWFDSIIDKNVGGGTVHYSILVEGCTIGANNSSHDGGSPQVIYYNTSEDRAIVNSTILGGRSYFKNGRLFCTNCLILSSMVGANIKVEQSYNTIFTNSASMKLDSDYRPVFGKYAGIDRGDVSACTALGDWDVCGTPRILNGAIDIGAVEYDWRPTFSQEIGNRFAVTYASPSVTTNAAGGVIVGGGQGLSALPCVAGKVPFAGPFVLALDLSGGTLEVYVDGVVAVNCDTPGEQVVRFNVPDEADEVRFVFTPDDSETPGAAVLKRLVSNKGIVIRFL